MVGISYRYLYGRCLATSEEISKTAILQKSRSNKAAFFLFKWFEIRGGNFLRERLALSNQKEMVANLSTAGPNCTQARNGKG